MKLKNYMHKNNKNMMDSFYELRIHYPWLDLHEWSFGKVNNRFVLTNNFTTQEYTTEKIFLYSAQIKEMYKARAACPIPNTPKIIISESQKDKKSLNILVQRATSNIETFLQQLPDFVLVLQNLKALLTVFEALVRKYGHFRIVPNMIKVNKNDLCQVWINQFQESCQREFPLNSRNATEDSRTMIIDLAHIFMKSGQSQIITPFYNKVAHEKLINFQTAKNYVNELIMRGRRVISAKNNILRGESPQGTEAAKTNKIPSFLKNKVLKFKRKSSKNQTLKNDSMIKEQKKNASMVYLNKSQSPSNFNRNYTHSSHVQSCKALNLNGSDSSICFKNSQENVQKSERKTYAKSSEKRQNQSHHLFPQRTESRKKGLAMYVSTPQSPTQEGLLQVDNTKSFVAERRKSGVRDSGDSTNFHHSTKSSGKTEQTPSQSQKRIISSFGMKIDDSHPIKSSHRFQIQNSRIIEEKNQEAPNSIHSIEQSDPEMKPNETDLERDIQTLLQSDIFTKKKIQRKTTEDYSFLEKEMNNILGL